jgi:hypothetical protein
LAGGGVLRSAGSVRGGVLRRRSSSDGKGGGRRPASRCGTPRGVAPLPVLHAGGLKAATGGARHKRRRTHGRQGVVEVGLGHTQGLGAQLNRARTPRNVRRARQEQWRQRHGGFGLWPKARLRWARTGRRLGRWARVGPTGSAQSGRIVFFRIYF